MLMTLLYAGLALVSVYIAVVAAAIMIGLVADAMDQVERNKP